MFDPAENYGMSCPPNGECTSDNPINIGAGNKTRAETDYRAGGNSPLSFARYYNSLPQNFAGSHHYRATSYEQAFGTSSYGHVASQPSDQNERFGLIGVGTIGVGWRHTYQRTVKREVSSLLTSAFVYRQDGRVLVFTKMSGQWYAQADVNLRLAELVDGGGAQTGWKLTLDDNSTETYSLAGRLTSIRNPSGIELTLTYDGCYRVQTVTDSFGNSLTFAYTTSCGSVNPQRLATVTVPGGGTYQYGYDSSGRLTTVTDPANKTRQYHYENTSFPMSLTGITDESSQRYATFGYDTYGRANLSELAGGADRISIAYPATGITVPSATVTVPSGAAIDYTFTVTQGRSKLSTQSADCEGCPVNAKSMTYDANGNISIRKDFKDVETRYSYDLTRNLETSRTEAYGTPKARTITTTWHSTFRLPTQIDEPNRRTAFTYDTSGNALTRTATDLSVTPNVSRTWTYTYNSFGQVLTEDGPRTGVSDVTTYTYYGSSATCAASVTGASTTGCRGQVETITNALSHVTTLNEFNAHGQPLMMTDPNGLVSVLTYDALQRVTSRTASGETTSFEYWPTGLLKKLILPDSSYLQYTYDAAHRLTQVADSENNRIVYTLDAAGNRTKEETLDPSSYLVRQHHRAFSTLNQLWKEIGAANTAAVTTTFGYDANGNQTSANAPLGRSTSSLYDELDRLKQITDPTSGVTLFAYDANDNLTSVTDPRGKVTSYAYTGFGDLKQQTSPDTGVTNNVYDSAGNLSTSTDARSKTGTYTYDALNRPTQLSYPDQTITYTYDTGTNNKGRLMQVSDSSGSTAWTYTTLGRVSGRGQVMGSVTKSVGYGYNSVGQLTSLVTPSGQTITYGYSSNRISSITVNSTTLLSSVLHDPFGPVRQWTWGNSTLAVRSFDLDGNIDQLDSAGLRTYDHDDAFRIVSIADEDTPSLDAVFTYDKSDRLKEVLSEFPEPLTVQVDATTATPGQTVEVTVTGVPAGSGYWLALASTSAPSTTYTKWVEVVPTSGTFEWNVTMPFFAGTYEVRLFLSNFELLALSPSISVSSPSPPGQPTLNVSATKTTPGASVTARLAGGLGGSGDWLALSLVGSSSTSYVQYTYVGSGVTNRDWTVTMPSAQNSYEFRLYLNNTYTITTTSPAVVLTNTAPVSGSGTLNGFTYDLNGNRLSGEGSTYTISSTSNRLSSVGGAINRSYSYDAAGNTSSYNGLTFTYNDAGRMTGVSGGASASYSNNALGQRVKKSVGGGVITYFVYDEAGHLIGEYDGSGALIQETVWLEDIPVATLRPNGGSVSIFHVHADHLNTPRRISRPSDSVIVWRWDSDPFGTEGASQDPDGDTTQFTYNLRFPGQYFDVETGLSYNYFRDYDPQIGRYVESDPLGLAAGLNTYLYVLNNPNNLADPTGELVFAPVLPFLPAIGQFLVDVGTVAFGLWALYDDASQRATEREQRQAEYGRASNFCDKKPPQGNNECSTLSRYIDHAKQCIALYEAWDAKWMPGRHQTKIAEWKNRLNNLKAEHKSKCTQSCP